VIASNAFAVKSILNKQNEFAILFTRSSLVLQRY